MGIGALLVSPGGLRDLIVRWLLVALTMGHRAAPTIALVSMSECMRIHGLRRWDGGKVGKSNVCGCRRIGSDLSTQSGIALGSVVLCRLEQWREVAVAVEEV
jgi:hypothetical protein